MSELQPGVYEALLTELLAGQLPLDEQLYRLEDLAAVDAPGALAQYIALLAERTLRAPRFESDRASQVDLCNRLIATLQETAAEQPTADLIVDEGRRLLEVLRPPTSPLARIEPTERPSTPLSQNALLVAAKQEPVLAAELRRELASADRVDLLCAFVRWSGIRVLLDALRDAYRRGVPLRVITTTYTGATEARALDELARLGADIRVSYETGSTRLHAKAWLFQRDSGLSTAYIGSSNLSHTALHDGLEWNVRLSQAASPALLQRFRAAFDTYWEEETFKPYDEGEFRLAIGRELPPSGSGLAPFDLQPYQFQRQMLYDLEVERERHGRWHNLIVAATGTGKTMVSAFDYKRVSEQWRGASLLFVAHRKEILNQALTTFRSVLRDGNFGELMVAGERPRDGHAVFASIQSLTALGRRQIDALPPDAYDIVIVDEFHHAQAATYRRLLERLQPKLLLGMTATPERSDGLDIKHWFEGRIAVDLRLWDALDQGLLCPFQYFGVADDVDLSHLTWRHDGYDAADLDRIYTGNDLRVAKVLKAIDDLIEDRTEMRALGFCVSVGHAVFMADRFNKAGIRAKAISTHSTPDERSQALRELRERAINVIFAVDLFNEGLDIPEIDTIFFLRPTESPVVFLQQLGRGLRRIDGKSGLTVLDFIGQQHRRFRFEERFRALTGNDRRRLERQIEEGFPFLPPGCTITLDRQSERAILDNIRRGISSLRSRLGERLRELGNVDLATFVASSGFSIDDVYAGNNPGWTALRRDAGYVEKSDPEEPVLSRALARMLHIDDPARIDAYRAWLAQSTPPNPAALGDRQVRLLNMLHFDLWADAAAAGTPLTASLERLWANPLILQELRELLRVLSDRAGHLVPGAGLEPEIPLCLHTRYSRNELLAALGESTSERPSPWREGIRWVERYKLDVLTVTLNKSEKRFSPSTRYRDYPISPQLFHWESQSTTRESSPTGQRYIHHHNRGSRVLLFVRESDVGDSIGASPFLCLGTARYVSHQGERPMAITWRLDHAMPPDFFQAARVSA